MYRAILYSLSQFVSRQKSVLERRAKWEQNIENLQEMMHEERRRERELVKQRYREELEHEENNP